MWVPGTCASRVPSATNRSFFAQAAAIIKNKSIDSRFSGWGFQTPPGRNPCPWPVKNGGAVPTGIGPADDAPARFETSSRTKPEGPSPDANTGSHQPISNKNPRQRTEAAGAVGARGFRAGAPAQARNPSGSWKNRGAKRSGFSKVLGVQVVGGRKTSSQPSPMPHPAVHKLCPGPSAASASTALSHPPQCPNPRQRKSLFCLTGFSPSQIRPSRKIAHLRTPMPRSPSENAMEPPQTPRLDNASAASRPGPPKNVKNPMI